MNHQTTGLASAIHITGVGILFIVIGCSGRGLPESTNLHMEGAKAAAAGDHAKAVDFFTRSIDEDPNPDAYFDRARSLLALGREQDVIRDCDAGLAMDAEHQDLKWLRTEAEKPEPQRFRGVHAEPPSHRR